MYKWRNRCVFCDGRPVAPPQFGNASPEPPSPRRFTSYGSRTHTIGVLGVEMANESFDRSTVAVAGGLLAVGVTRPELYEEETGRWIALPQTMIAKRQGVGLVSVPAAALAATVAH